MAAVKFGPGRADEMIPDIGEFVSWIFSDFGVDVADPSAAKSSGDGP